VKSELGRLWKELVLPCLKYLPGLPEVAEEIYRNSSKIFGFASGIRTGHLPNTGIVTLRVFRLSQRCSWVLSFFWDVTL
jgi:hypothetical protein